MRTSCGTIGCVPSLRCTGLGKGARRPSLLNLFLIRFALVAAVSLGGAVNAKGNYNALAAQACVDAVGHYSTNIFDLSNALKKANFSPIVDEQIEEISKTYPLVALASFGLLDAIFASDLNALDSAKLDLEGQVAKLIHAGFDRLEEPMFPNSDEHASNHASNIVKAPAFKSEQGALVLLDFLSSQVQNCVLISDRKDEILTFFELEARDFEERDDGRLMYKRRTSYLASLFPVFSDYNLQIVELNDDFVEKFRSPRLYVSISRILL